MTALENVLVGMHSRLKGGILGSILGTPRVRREEREAEQKARELLSFSGLRGVDDELAESLSYGDQRRLEVARALATEPKLLLLDEPTAGMNPQETVAFLDFVSKVREQQTLSILLIEHDMKVVMGASERVTVLDYGEKIAEGAARDPAREASSRAYLGRPPQRARAPGGAETSFSGWRTSRSMARSRRSGNRSRCRGRDRHADRANGAGKSATLLDQRLNQSREPIVFRKASPAGAARDRPNGHLPVAQGRRLFPRMTCWRTRDGRVPAQDLSGDQSDRSRLRALPGLPSAKPEGAERFGRRAERAIGRARWRSSC
jgi:hypothetical protein